MDQQELQQLIEEHLSISNIASAAGVSYRRVRYWLRVWGLKSKGYQLRRKPKPKPLCKNCGKEVRRRPNVYCSFLCQGQYNRRRRMENNPEAVGRQALKGYLLDYRERRCEVCSITQWMGKPAPLELDHKDGNSTNNELSNLRLICPNCHAQTDTYKGRNMGQGRYYRRERYAQGKSY